MTLSNLPPGVSESDPHITGEWPCNDCGTTLPEEVECHRCKGDTCNLCEDARERLAEGYCPGGCPERDWDTERELREENDYDRRMGL